MIFDLHMHTSRYSPDSIIDPYELVERALEIGLSGIVITEHDRLWPEAELEELRNAAPGLVVLAGVEITARQGDVLCYGVRDIKPLPKGVDWVELCREVHRQGGACVAAHPFRWQQDFDDIWSTYQPELDGMEMMSNNMDSAMRAQAAAFRARFPQLTGLGNSDAHEIEVLGHCVTEFGVEVRTTAQLVAAIRGGKTTYRPFRA
jgi:predicted metal-dependent phosphoesterase TrpH